MKKTLLFSALMFALPLSGSAFAASFNCAKAGSANEKIICGDAELSALDDRLGKTFKAARTKAANRRVFMAESDKQWRWREDNCRDKACLLSWYQRRNSELSALADGSLEAVVKLPATSAAKAAPVTQAPAPVKSAEPVKPFALNTPAEAIASPAAAADAKVTPPAEKEVVPSVPAPQASISAPAPVTTPEVAKHIVTPPVVVKADPVKAVPSPTPSPAPALASKAPAATPAVTTEEPSLRSRLNKLNLATLATGGVLPKAHYTSVNQGEYTYEDARIDPASGKPGIIGVRYLGMENGQYIIEAAQREGILRYTCSADCRYINKLLLPGDVKRDTVVLDNDNVSVASLIVNDVINGLLAPSRPH